MPKSSRKKSSGSESEQEVKKQTKPAAKKMKIDPKSFATPQIHSLTKALPTRSATNTLVFEDFPSFSPNLSPKEILQLGSFGGTYFRTIHSSITGKTYSDAHKEFPADWFAGLDIAKAITAKVYVKAHNTYKIDCGGGLDMWEESGWIRDIDPFGWFQWYCRFYLGRRSDDDERQVARGLGVFGPTGDLNYFFSYERSMASKSDK